MASRQGDSNKEDTHPDDENAAELAKQKTMNQEDGVGQLQETGVMSIGIAPRESEPQAKINAFGDGDGDGDGGPDEKAEAALDHVEDEKSDAGPIVKKKEKQAYKPRAEAFKYFKNEDGK